MILSCNSCKKKFVVPDQAITVAGRTVQCGSCGNKWKQYPIKNEIKTTQKVIKDSNIKKIPVQTKISKPKNKIASKNKNKKKEISLYSPEYLAKKHGISLNDSAIETPTKSKIKNKVSFGFYNTLIFLLVITIAFSRSLYFFQEFIVQKIPFTKFYLDYFFESIKNMFEIWKNLISSY